MPRPIAPTVCLAPVAPDQGATLALTVTWPDGTTVAVECTTGETERAVTLRADAGVVCTLAIPPHREEPDA